MKIQTKKIILVILSLIVVFTTSLFVVACDKEKPSAIGWENQSQTVVLGSMYWIEKPLAKLDDVEYDVSVTVYDSNKKVVPIFKNNFDILDINGYTVVFTADVNGRTEKMNLTLSVKDESSPIISLKNLNSGIVNQKYSFNAVNVSDLSKQEVTLTYKVYLIDGDSRTLVDSTISGFTPTEIGDYLIEVEAKDKSDNVTIASTIVTIRSTIVDNEIEFFDDEGALSSNFAFDGQNFANTQSVTGLSKFTAKNQGMSFVFNSNKLEKIYYVTVPRVSDETLTEAVEGGYYISAYIYIADNVAQTRQINYKSTVVATIPTNQWCQIVIDEDNYVKASELLKKIYTGRNFVEIFNVLNPNKDEFIVYIDDLKLCNSSVEVEIANTSVNYNVNQEIVFDVQSGLDYQIKHNGTTMLLSDAKFTPRETGKYTFIASAQNGEYGYDSFDFNVVDSDNDLSLENGISTFVTSSVVKLSTAKLNGADCTADYYVVNNNTGETIRLQGNSLVKVGLTQGLYTYYAKVTVGNNVYTDSINFILTDKDVKFVEISQPGLFRDFSDYFAKQETSDSVREYFGEYENATGVHYAYMKKSGGGFAGITKDGGLYDKEYYQAHDVVVFRVYTNKSASFAFYNDRDGWSEFTVVPDAEGLTNCWTDYTVSASKFLELYDKLQVQASGMWMSANRLIAFDSILFTKNLPLEVSVDGVFVGKETTIIDNFADVMQQLNLSNGKITVLNNNKEIAVNNNKFTSLETGLIEIIYTATDENQLLYRFRLVQKAIELKLTEESGLYNDFTTKFNKADFNYTGYTSGEGYYREHLDEFEGASGVVKLAVHGARNFGYGFRLSAHHSREYYEAHDKIVMRVWSNKSSNVNLCFNDSTNGNVWVDKPFIKDALGITNAWTDYEMDISTFMTFYNGLQAVNPNVWMSENRILYIDSIYAVRNINVVSNVQVATKDVEFTIDDNIDEAIAQIGYNVSELTLKVLLNNKEIEVVDGKFTPTETGHLEIYYSAIDDAGRLCRGKYAYKIS